jgi:beta-glucosidase/6-phospho-beta-glucosidase/beta-galactosidase
LKQQLVRAALAGIAAARRADPDVVVISAEPMINIVPDSDDPSDLEAARNYHEAQFAALDMMLGTLAPELGGSRDAVDVIGINFYPHNQWRLQGGPVPLGRHDYRPCSELLAGMYERYGKPMLIAETGAEHSARPVWLSYVAQEVRTAIKAGVPILGICLYPVTDYHGWDNNRHCEVGLFCGVDAEKAERTVYLPLADELHRQQALFDAMQEEGKA